MSTSADEILQEALGLPLDARADVAVELLASLDDDVLDDDPDVIEAEWAAELMRRADKVISGEDPGEEWGTVRNELRQRLRG